LLLSALIGVLILAAAASYLFIFHEEPPPTPPAAAATKPPAASTPNAPSTLPGKAIAKAQDTLAARRDSDHGRIDAMIDGETSSPSRPPNTPPPSEPAPAPITATSQLAPGITATTTTSAITDSPAASPAFRNWVANARINGVFQGTPARALINGRTFRAGQVIDDDLGIVFQGLTDDAKSIVFRDASGATITRRF